MEQKKVIEPFEIERTYSAPVNQVWEAITDRNKMKEWYFDLEEFKPEVGFQFEFSGGPPEKQYLHRCIITEVVVGKKLRYSWEYVGYTGYSEVTFELFADGDKTMVKLTHSGLGSFPADNRDFAKNNFMVGWTSLIGSSLKAYLEKV